MPKVDCGMSVLVDADEWCTADEVRERLGLASNETVRQLCKKGLLASNNVATKGRRYAKRWVDDLDRLIENYPPISRLDKALFELYALHRKYYDLPDCSQYRRKIHKAEIRSACKELVKSGRVWTTKQLASALGVSAVCVRKWARSDRMSTVQFGRTHYLTAHYASHLIKVWFEWKTVLSLAEEYEVLAYSIWESIRLKRLPAVKFPDGVFRVDPEVFRRHLVTLLKAKSEAEPLVTIDEAVRRIGCKRQVFMDRLCEGTVIGVGQLNTRRIPEYEVVRWEKWFTCLNDEFSWLDPIIKPLGRKPQILSTKQVAARLKISGERVGAWSKQGLLPFFPGSFTAPVGGSLVRLFVRRYIVGLQLYAGGGKVKCAHARAYKRLCQEKGNIV